MQFAAKRVDGTAPSNLSNWRRRLGTRVSNKARSRASWSNKDSFVFSAGLIAAMHRERAGEEARSTREGKVRKTSGAREKTPTQSYYSL